MDLIIFVLIFLAILCKPIRKTIGLLMVIFGILGIMTIIGFIPGVILIILGGIFLFSG